MMFDDYFNFCSVRNKTDAFHPAGKNLLKVSFTDFAQVFAAWAQGEFFPRT